MNKNSELTEEKFLTEIEEIDNNLREEVMLFFRPAATCDELAARYNLPRTFPAPSTKPKINSFKDHIYLMRRVFDWYKRRYGEKMKTDFLGNIALSIRGEVYKMSFYYGRGVFYPDCSIETFNKSQKLTSNDGNPPTLNILNLIEGITDDLVKSLTELEIEEILYIFNIGHNAKYRMNSLMDVELIKQAKGNIDAASAHFFSNPSQLGASKWESLQAAEKLLKAYIQLKDINYNNSEKLKEFGHNLKKLKKKAESLGLPEIPKSTLKLIQCSPSIRYGDEKVTLDEAITAHHASLDICWGVANQIKVARRINKNVILHPNRYYVDGGANIWRCIGRNRFVARMLIIENVQDGIIESKTVEFKRNDWKQFFIFNKAKVTQPLEQAYQEILKSEYKNKELAKKIVPFC